MSTRHIALVSGVVYKVLSEGRKVVQLDDREGLSSALLV